MALTADRNVDFFASQELVDLPVEDNVCIYKGALVGRERATGYARPLIAGDDFLGVAYRRADNTGSGHAAGALTVRLHQMIDIVYPLAGAVQSDLGKDVYASADDTLTLTPNGNSRIGRIVALQGAGMVRVRCRPVTALTGVLENLPMLTLADASATLTLDHVNRTLLIANTASRTLTLPPAAQVRAGGWLRVVKTSADAFAVILDGNAVETIDGDATYAALDAAYDAALLLCTGTEWIVLSRDVA